MSYRSILLHVDDGERFDVRMAIACDIARRHDAHVSATYAVAPRAWHERAVRLEGSSSSPGAPGERDAARPGRGRRSFDAAQAGPRVVWDELHDEAPMAGFLRRALAADLLVLGQQDSSRTGRAAAAEGFAAPEGFAEAVVMDSGTPAIIVPNCGDWRSVARVVLVAWKPTPQAARAVRAALPLLREAEEVHVTSRGGAPRQIQTWLWRHDIDAEFHHAPDRSPSQIGECLLATADDVGADLMVMGCYGHGRLREQVIGGATRTVLASMTVPVLMAS